MVRPAAGGGAGDEVLRWTYQPYLQRQLCFTSMTGLFSCAEADLEDLPEKATGEAPLPATPEQTAPGQATPAQATPSPAAPAPNLAAEAARIGVIDSLRARADALFDDDRRLKLDPMLKAAGVHISGIPSATQGQGRPTTRLTRRRDQYRTLSSPLLLPAVWMQMAERSSGSTNRTSGRSSRSFSRRG